ncbi:LemA family protein [Calothrix parasitica NIES-267]|uniref:LemA family protein n=1 Tax=Calothrix parasitica NIES-267 TaxID=1973488 RepID=A0A1Z4LWC0_9CYAN|nr:LemA family protein [Calothrix parasitica NIES-267]
MGLFIFVGAVIATVLAIIINSYNDLVKYRNRYKNAYAQINVQLQRRYDLIPNLVETAKGYMKYEQETLEAINAARDFAITISSLAAKKPGDSKKMKQLSSAEVALNGALNRLIVIAESYPELKADKAMSQVMEELSSTENRIAFARQAFNDAVTIYNIKREAFPSNLVGDSFSFNSAYLLEGVASEVRNTPRVSF